MSAYKPDKLREYIEKSELRIVSNDFHIRLSPEMAKKYDSGVYDKELEVQKKNFEKINSLGIVYPAGAKPVFYIYIVPTDSGELLDFPKGVTTGGKPVLCFDLDWFPSAYGVTENGMIYGFSNPEIGNIHEIAHLIHYMFSKNSGRLISEGIAEVFPYYLLDYEKSDSNHSAMIKNMTNRQILNAQSLIYDFDKYADYSKSAQFTQSYISSYLFVRGVISRIEKKFKISKIAAMQKLLEFLRGSRPTKEFLVFALADFIGMDRKELLVGKTLQLEVQSEIAKLADKKPKIKSATKVVSGLSDVKAKKPVARQKLKTGK